MAVFSFKLNGAAALAAKIKELKQKSRSTFIDILQRAALSAEALMKNRTVEKGRDVNEVPFKPYSVAYAKKKAKKLGHAPTKVDLFMSGVLMNSFFKENQPHSSILLYIAGGAGKYGAAHQAGDRQPKREWFGLSDREERAIQDQISEEVSRFFAL